jgi:anaerobic carbon-monoxide dehydrogenase catalytic subunit
MEFIQKKTADNAVEHFLPKAADKGTKLAWDRFEGQLPECGFCESGLSCRDCLQGPCISHPFRDANKLGVCGKDKDVLAVQTLLRLVLKGTMANLDQVSDFVEGIACGAVKPKDADGAKAIIAEIEALLKEGGAGLKKAFPKALLAAWEEAGICPQGVAKDIFKASQKVEGGIAGVEETLFWAFKAALLGAFAQKLQGGLKKAVFGGAPAEIEVNMGVLKKDSANVLLYGRFSPILKAKIAAAAAKKSVAVAGVCTDPLLAPYTFAPVTSYGSQELPLMSGAVDLIVVGDQFVNPSLAAIAAENNVAVVSTEGLKAQVPEAFAKVIVDKAVNAFEFRRSIARDIPEAKEPALMGLSAADVDVKKIADAMAKGKIKGIAVIAGTNNVKFTQDLPFISMAQEFLKGDVLCISEGDASVSLAKYGFLNPRQCEKHCGAGVAGLLKAAGKNLPAVLDFGYAENGGVAEFLLALSAAAKKPLKELPVLACFAEANRNAEVAEALCFVAMGVSTYFWPSLPVTGSAKTMEALAKLCGEKFGAKLIVHTDKKMEPLAKARMIMKVFNRVEDPSLKDHPWTDWKK